MKAVQINLDHDYGPGPRLIGSPLTLGWGQHLLIRPVLHRGELSGIPEHSSVRENGPKSSRVKLTLKFGRGSEIRTHGSSPK